MREDNGQTHHCGGIHYHGVREDNDQETLIHFFFTKKSERWKDSFASWPVDTACHGGEGMVAGTWASSPSTSTVRKHREILVDAH